MRAETSPDRPDPSPHPVVPSVDLSGVGGTHLYDGVIFDSEGIEKPFIQDLERRRDVKLYIKLPDWFKVPTPIGSYEPDWAIVMDNPEDGDPMLYLVRETKGTLDLGKLRPDEERKIRCGRQHFGVRALATHRRSRDLVHAQAVKVILPASRCRHGARNDAALMVETWPPGNPGRFTCALGRPAHRHCVSLDTPPFDTDRIPL